MNPNQEEAYRWFRQAGYDLDAAGVNAGAGFAAVACFLAQQAAEKALKAFLYAQGERAVLGHATHLLLRQCQQYDASLAAFEDVCRRLDQYYIPTRYPNGLPGGVPHEVYSPAQAAEAIRGARELLETIRTLILPTQESPL